MCGRRRETLCERQTVGPAFSDGIFKLSASDTLARNRTPLEDVESWSGSRLAKSVYTEYCDPPREMNGENEDSARTEETRPSVLGEANALRSPDVERLAGETKQAAPENTGK